ncbi:radical SAM-linked protein [Clostridium grantii DSM 8605]|uniref:Radical SAM-linked protein n=2 Tax=Clostridium TaxID=1485 RepID=A0A1M5X4F7_9CLOT|nr:radical SAM-linked protein [Clostridium grantii DSM 8605]
MRYLIKFTKEGEIKFVGHLELMRTIQRTVRRSEIPAEYSRGFNPHLVMSLAQPLSVGVYSVGEYMDLSLAEEMEIEDLINSLNQSSPNSMRFLDATKIEEFINVKKKPQAMAAVEMASYRIKIKIKDSVKTEEQIKKLVKETEWNIVKKSKKTTKEVNIKPLIHKFDFQLKENQLIIEVLVACGSEQNLSARLLADFIAENTDFVDKEAFVDICRLEMYATKKGKLLPLIEFLK